MSTRLPSSSDAVSRIAYLTKHIVPSSPRPLTTMSAPNHNPAAAPWRAPFLEHIASMPSPEFSLATLQSTTQGTFTSSSPPGSSSPPYLPRARYCIFRGMFGALSPNPKNDAPFNPPLYTSDLLTFTTDARMHKVPDMFGRPVATSGTLGSGGGGEVEAVFWAKDKGTQWRVRGAAWVLAPDIESDSKGEGEGRGGEVGIAGIREQIWANMRPIEGEEKSELEGKQNEAAGEVVQPAAGGSPESSGPKHGGGGDWSFTREITAHFGNLSPGMRGTFRNPPPGTPLSEVRPGGNNKVGVKVTDLHEPAARANFRVVVIVPEEVDRADLSNPDEPRRWVYRNVGKGRKERASVEGAERDGDWEVFEVWP